MWGPENQRAKACAERPEAPLDSLPGFFRIFVSWESGCLALAYITNQMINQTNLHRARLAGWCGVRGDR